MDKLFLELLDMLDRHQKPDRIISVGTDCSGIESPLIALDLMGIKYKHIFSSEIDKNCIEFIKRNFPPKMDIIDLKDRDNKSIENIDLYIAGFPCQSFSSLGKNEGFHNATKGTIFFYVHDFIRINQPKVFILENVRALKTHDKGRTFKIIMDALHSITDRRGVGAYKIYHTILNTKDLGIPQSRNRVFIVGILNEKTEYMFPSPLNRSIPINMLLDHLPETELTKYNAKRYDDVKDKYPDIDFDNETYIFNLGVSSIKWFRLGQLNLSPCIVTSPHFYITDRHRYMTAHEALRLQCIPWRKYDFNFPENVLLKFAGNTISVNVMIALLGSIFDAVDFRS